MEDDQYIRYHICISQESQVFSFEILDSTFSILESRSCRSVLLHVHLSVAKLSKKGNSQVQAAVFVCRATDG